MAFTETLSLGKDDLDDLDSGGGGGGSGGGGGGGGSGGGGVFKIYGGGTGNFGFVLRDIFDGDFVSGRILLFPFTKRHFFCANLSENLLCEPLASRQI